MTVDWQIASLGWDDAARIDLNVQRREGQRRVFIRARRKGLMIVCIAVYAVAILTPSTMSIIGQRNAAQGLAHQISDTNGKIKNLQQLAGDLDSRQLQWKQYQATERVRRSWGDALAAVAAACPGKVYLDHIQVDSQSGAIVITGASDDAQFLNSFVLQLQQSAAFSNVTLSESSTDPTLTQGQLRFKIDAVCSLPLSN